MGFSSETRTLAPSRRIVAFIIVIVAIITAVAVSKLAPQQAPDAIVLSNETVPRAIVAETDTDGDGLMDWEEVLWGYNATQPDTDGDGVGDAQEVADNRSRMAQIEADLIANVRIGSSTEENLTQTDLLTRSLVEQAVAFDSAGISLDPETSLSMADKFLGYLNLTDTLTLPAPLTGSELLIVADSPEALRTYGNTLGAILGGTPTAETSEVIVLTEFGQTGDATVLDKLDAVQQTYETIALQLLQTPTPQSIASTHLNLINAFRSTGATFDSLKKIGTDPLSSVVGMQAYRAHSTQLSLSFEAIKTYLRSYATFEKNEPGYIMIIEEPTPQQ